MISPAPMHVYGRHGWTTDEFEELMRLYSSQACRRNVSWSTAMTEPGDPQFFLIGPEPEADCVLAISRLRGKYVLEDGEARPLCEGRVLSDVVQEAQRMLPRRFKPSLVARLLVPLACIRAFIDEKIEPLVPDSIEVLLPIASFV
jgi:hypothetical protein